ncbi:MAG TPA: hypothetical protein VM782_05345 [Stellaceae bacterium]|nr:hypothetical protein [Stellaceae bacterium]
MPALDLIDDDAAPAKEIIGAFKPAMSKDEDLASTSAPFKKERYSAATA